jgi:hypothetical protein
VNLFVKFSLRYSKRVINYNFALNSTFLTYCFENPNGKEVLMKGTVKRRKLLPKWIIGVLLLMISLFAFSPNAKAAVTGKIAGIVRDAETGEPLPGANVVIEGTDRGAACDADGYYYIIRLDPGNYNVQARMMGYKAVTQTGVRVISGHTTPLDFQLEETIVEGEGVTVQATREVVKMDVVGSSFAADRSEIEAVPLISDVREYLNYQAGIDGWSIRGGGVAQTRLMADGLLLVDQRANEPIMMPNLSEIKEVSLLKGGFNAEFSNVRSGVVNVVTREGSPDVYQGSFEFRYTPGYQKHGGKSIFDPYNFYNAPYFWNKFDTAYWHYVYDTTFDDSGNVLSLDLVSQDTFIGFDSVCWKGVEATWNNSNSPFYDTVKYKNYPKFDGWILVVAAEDITPEERMAMLIWRRRINTEEYDGLPQWNRDTYFNTVRDSLGNIISQDTIEKLMPDYAYAPVYDFSGGDTTLVGFQAFPWEPREGEEWPCVYGDKPDWTVDAGFGGPIPIIGSYLGDLSFYASYRDHNETFAIPDSREYYRERMASLKLTSRFGNVKLNLRGAYSITNSLSAWTRGDEEAHEEFYHGFNGQVYLRGGADMLQSIGEWDRIYHGSDKLSPNSLYRANALTPFDVTSRMYGLTMQHALSENTFYDVKLTYIRSNNDANFYYDVPRRMAGDTVVRWFGPMDTTPWGGSFAVDNIPYGYCLKGQEGEGEEGDRFFDIGGSDYGTNYGSHSQLGAWDESWSQTYNVSFDMTSQLDKINQIKFGLSFQYDRIDDYWIANDGWVWPEKGEEHTFEGQQYLYNGYEATPILAGGYVQDKIEFEGMYANFGIRFDYADPHTEWPDTSDRYSVFFTPYLKDSLLTLAPSEQASASFKLSPRLGISFPVLERSKLFFNYGHFYSLPPNEYRYNIIWGDNGSGVLFIGNPSLDMERTISYEVGLESSIANTFLARVSGYYKDTENEYATVRYTGMDEHINYMTVENSGYGDTRGFEVELRKDAGRFFTGWINYDYRVTTEGQTGKETYYQDVFTNMTQGKVELSDDDPLPRPVLRAQVTLKSPLDWGVFFGGYNFSFLYSRRAGRYDTYIGPNDRETWEDELRNNIQWPDECNLDIGVSKNIEIAGAPISLFMDIHNVFDWQVISGQAFDPQYPTDQTDYYRSLHLEMYKEEPWAGTAGHTAPEPGEEPDKVGDLRSDENPYIDNPNREFLYYLDPRYVQFGIRFSF